MFREPVCSEYRGREVKVGMSGRGLRSGGPEAILLDEDVGEDEELPHDGGDGDLGGLAGVTQRPVLSCEVGIAADGGHTAKRPRTAKPVTARPPPPISAPAGALMGRVLPNARRPRLIDKPVSKVPWKARRAPAVARREVRRMAIRVISSDERQSRRPQMSVAQRVTRRFRSAARRARRHVPGTARRYANGAGARNAARVTVDTGC